LGRKWKLQEDRVDILARIQHRDRTQRVRCHRIVRQPHRLDAQCDIGQQALLDLHEAPAGRIRSRHDGERCLPRELAFDQHGA
jgi:hypothetical protein